MSRSLPGQRARSKGCSNFSFGNARTTLKGGGGSGEPTTREVVQGARGDFAVGASPGLGESATDGTSRARNPTTSNRGRDSTARDRRCPLGQGDRIKGAPDAATRTRVPPYWAKRGPIVIGGSRSGRVQLLGGGTIRSRRAISDCAVSGSPRN